MTIRRYQLTSGIEKALERKTPAGAIISISAPFPSQLVDIDVTPGSEEEVDWEMESLGYAFVGASPTDTTSDAAADPSILPAQAINVFGDAYKYAESAVASTTTSTSFIQKLQLAAPVLLGGKYHIGWSYSWGISKKDTIFLARVRIDGANTILDHKQSADVEHDKPFNWFTASGFYQYTATSDKTIKIDIDYATRKSRAASSIKDARLTIWRVG